MYLNAASVRRIMRLAGWTTAELSRRMFMDQAAVKRLLAGDQQPSHRSIASLLVAVWREFGNAGSCLCGDLFVFIDEHGREVTPPHATQEEAAS